MRDSLLRVLRVFDFLAVLLLFSLLRSRISALHRRRDVENGPTLAQHRPVSLAHTATSNGSSNLQSRRVDEKKIRALKFRSQFSADFTTGSTPGTGLKRTGRSARVDLTRVLSTWTHSGTRNRPRKVQRKNSSTKPKSRTKSKWRLFDEANTVRTTHTLSLLLA